MIKHLLIKHATKHLANIYKADEFKRMEGNWYETLLEEYLAIFKQIAEMFGGKAAMEILVEHRESMLMVEINKLIDKEEQGIENKL